MLEPQISSTQLFAGLPPDITRELTAKAETRKFRRGDIVFRQGDVAEEIFLIVKGQIGIASQAPDGREALVARLDAGAIFGELPLFDGQPRSADARALESSRLLAIPYGDVHKVIDQQPELLWSLLQMMATRLRAADEALADAAFLDVAGRTAKRVLEMAGTNEEFATRVTQEELASMVGASRERVNRALAEFIRMGWIELLDRGRYRVIDRSALERRAAS